MVAQTLHHITPSEQNTPHYYTTLPPLSGQLLPHFTPVNTLPHHSYTNLLFSSHCSPLLHGKFSQRNNSSKLLPLQPIAAHSYMAILVRGGGNFSKALPLQPIAAHPYMAILVRGGNSSKFPPISAPCSPLQPIAAHSYMEISVRSGNFSKALSLQPIAAPSYMSILVRRSNSSTLLSLQPNSYIFLPPLNKIPPNSYINLPTIDKLPPPPPLLQQNGRILGTTFDQGSVKIKTVFNQYIPPLTFKKCPAVKEFVQTKNFAFFIKKLFQKNCVFVQ